MCKWNASMSEEGKKLTDSTSYEDPPPDPRDQASPYCRHPCCTFVPSSLPAFARKSSVDAPEHLPSRYRTPSNVFRLYAPEPYVPVNATNSYTDQCCQTPPKTNLACASLSEEKPSDIKLHRKIHAPDDRYLCTRVFKPATCWLGSKRSCGHRSWTANRNQSKGRRRDRCDRRHRWEHLVRGRDRQKRRRPQQSGCRMESIACHRCACTDRP
jgi:hypothetical protein